MWWGKEGLECLKACFGIGNLKFLKAFEEFPRSKLSCVNCREQSCFIRHTMKIYENRVGFSSFNLFGMKMSSDCCCWVFAGRCLPQALPTSSSFPSPPGATPGASSKTRGPPWASSPLPLHPSSAPLPGGWFRSYERPGVATSRHSRMSVVHEK